MPNLQKLSKWTPTGIQIEAQYLQKYFKNALQTAAQKKHQQVRDSNATEPSTSQNKLSAWERLHFYTFLASAQKIN